MKHEGPHKYKKVRLQNYKKLEFRDNNTVIWKCAKPGCTHTINIPELIIGRLCECWKCSCEFTITGKSALLTKPHCGKEECKRKTSRNLLTEIDDLAHAIEVGKILIY